MASVSSLRCYVCGGHSGTPCRGGLGAEQGLQGGDTEAATSEAGARVQDPVQECTDLINNRGCVKQFVNGGKYLKSNELGTIQQLRHAVVAPTGVGKNDGSMMHRGGW